MAAKQLYIVFLGTMLATQATAEVSSANQSGFSLTTSVTVTTSPAETYAILVQPNLWWDTTHSYSHKAQNLSINPVAGGCFCERLDDGGSVEHAHVVFASPGKVLRLRGAFGPLQGEGIDGGLTWELKPSGAGTEIRQTYAAGGYIPSGMEKMAEMLDPIFTGQASHLKSYIDGR
ncbi:SRPBCC family protein [Rhizobium sp. Leaf391]|uniref:SRPBCC family protein n=1 Tax=Rhizobium sp. Leaf391 TaxID=1736360 RepID=UPI000A6A0FAC|nr:SRPBCC family protein [Rhizobium sp. Leaf391]